MPKQHNKISDDKLDDKPNDDKPNVDLSESSVHASQPEELDTDDVATEAQIDRLEALTGGADNPPEVDGELAQEFDALDATTEEELDALKVDLEQDGDEPVGHEGAARVADDVAEEQVAAFTEVGPRSDARGAESVEPGHYDPSELLDHRQPHSWSGHDSFVIVGENIDPPKGAGLEEDNPEDHDHG